MRTTWTKQLSCVLATAMIASLASGCASSSTPSTVSKDSGSTSQTSASSPDGGKTYDKFLTVDMFNSQANFEGIHTGWFAKVVKDKFNMELNLISPNVAGGGDVLFQTRSAAGDLGDIVMIGSENGRLADTVKAELMYDITDLVAKSEHLTQYQAAIDNIKALISSDRVYAIPSQVSSSSPLTPSEGLDLTYGPYLRWDYYKELNYPQLKTMEDLLPVLKQMQENHPTSDSGKKVYALSLFKDWDGNMMNNAKQPACFYGYDEQYFTLLAPDGDVEYILESDSNYVRALKFFFSANQMGILDPDSTTQNYDTLDAKYRDGAVLYSQWPWQSQPAYNSQENKNAGKGFMIAPVEDLKIFSYGCNPLGNKYVIGVGSKAEDPERMVDFIDWLYSPEGVMLSSAQTNSSCGAEGLTWEFGSDGRPRLTDFGKKVFSGDDKVLMPEEWGGGTYKDGMSQLNFMTVSTMDINPVNNLPYNHTLWDTYLEDNVTALDKDWQTQMKAKTTLDYLDQHDGYVVAAGNGYIAPQIPADVDAIRVQCKDIIIAESWKMIFAKDEAEFNSLLKNMQDTVKGLGMDTVLTYEKTVTDDLTAARKAAVEAFK